MAKKKVAKKASRRSAKVATAKVKAKVATAKVKVPDLSECLHPRSYAMRLLWDRKHTDMAIADKTSRRFKTKKTQLGVAIDRNLVALFRSNLNRGTVKRFGRPEPRIAQVVTK